MQGPTKYPCCVGHEIVGNAVRVGSNAVGGIKVGDRVGLGAQSDSCLGRMGNCEECAMGSEQYCAKRFIATYNSIHFNGGKSYGGYAIYNRSPSQIVIKIPDAFSSVAAAPLLPGGVTLYSPLKHNIGALANVLALLVLVAWAILVSFLPRLWVPIELLLSYAGPTSKRMR